MTTRQRVDLLARAFPRLFPRAELHRMLCSQLGHVDALDTWVTRDGTRFRARPPKLIYHICAGNLAVSAWTSLAHGLLLGARNVVKLPGDRGDLAAPSATRAEILRFIRRLPIPLRKLVQTQQTLDTNLLTAADVVVAFGSDATMESLRAQTRWDQKFIAHGHALSLLWLGDVARLTPGQARACATDVLTYDQLGCLSPQVICLAPRADIESLGGALARAMERQWRATKPRPLRPLAVAARITEVRDLAQALGHRLWLPPDGHLGWTVIVDPGPAFRLSPLHGVVYLRVVSALQLGTTFASVAGRISTVGVVGRLSSRAEKAFLNLGVTRFCPAGRMQFPPLSWHHDGRSSLGELVTWIDAEGRA